ncbi:Na+/H+ antiporter subunit E [Fusibacter tunisiensis]|uniref:Multisubunit Na+/H+ antiporter MnhE subunit n=1 Tax=Fusibacter tunisiensis TaxID=1008308 RepID=A0ABS2MS42_9FIRM|nr:multisubunit Na+/H+ antiporter MnhE subunit [Fusibacter tunisiensis]
MKEGDFIKRIVYYGQLVALFSLFWVVLFESLSFWVLISAPIISILSLILSEKYLLKANYYDLYYFNIFWLLKYTVVLFTEIYKSGFSIIPNILSGHANPGIVDITTEVDTNIGIALIANSITLTPGTITMDVSGQKLKVLWIDPETYNPTMAGLIIKGRLEKLF